MKNQTDTAWHYDLGAWGLSIFQKSFLAHYLMFVCEDKIEFISIFIIIIIFQTESPAWLGEPGWARLQSPGLSSSKCVFNNQVDFNLYDLKNLARKISRQKLF